MQSGNQLGIYLRKDRATVVCLAWQGRDRKLLDCFSVRVEGEEPTVQDLCDRIARACADRKVRYTEAAVALDCESFMQHSVHSEFSDPRKIAATVRYDTEETLATDVSDVAVTFRIISSDEEGSRLDVFTVQRAFLTDVIQSLQVNGIDPMAIDPDIYCLSRYLIGCAEAQEAVEGGTLYAALSDCRGYLISLSAKQELTTLRTFLIGPAQERTSLLSREALVTTALATADPVERLCAADAVGELVLQSLGEKTGIPTGPCDLPALAGVESQDLADCDNTVDFALAYGAILGLAEKTNSVNFRNDHMPFLGKRLRLQKAVRFLSLSLTILLLAVGVFFHLQLLRENQHREALRVKLEPDYLAVMRGRESIPTAMTTAVDELGRALRTLRAEKTGVGDQESVSARLTLVLHALNSCAKQTDLDIDSITISGNSIIVRGTTSSRRNTLRVADAMREGGLAVQNHTYDDQGRRDSFSMTIEVIRQTQRT